MPYALGDYGAHAPDPAVAQRFAVVSGGRHLQLEVRARGRGAGLPFALVADGIEIELLARDLEWLSAVSPRALQRGRQEAG